MHDPSAPPAPPPHAGQPGQLAHHFDSPAQQHEAGGLGMWLFLATELLLFGGLFCAYAVYRSIHPEIFHEAATRYLNVQLGAVNTIILLCSSFTMATGVWAAQTSRKGVLCTMLALTFLGGCGFLGVKAIEYRDKWRHHLLWGAHFNPQHAADATADATKRPIPASAASPAAPAAPAASAPADRWQFAPAAIGPQGLAPASESDTADSTPGQVRNMHIFFGVYFAMTGLHGLHVVAGMAVIAWLLLRSTQGRFGAAYFTPVHLGGLYWHLVDIIWIYLFPLLYLIR